MNSLLQTLFMTPDLRQRLYLWTFEETEQTKKEDSIPYQLQLLFGRLQLGRQSVVDTRGLTKSFQWDSREAFTQHDVQEFCRVLFDAIERSVKGTRQHDMINELYQGILIDYVTCQTCGTESKREDKYLDVSLAVRNEFDHIYNDSLEKALSNFVRPETLSGANQYQCSKCNSKQNAIKGLRFKSFPKIFIIQLKRFDLDYSTFHKKKINDYVSFPHVLDLNKFVLGEEVKTEEEEKKSGQSTVVQFEKPGDVDARVLQLRRYKRSEENTLGEDREKLPLEEDPLSKEYVAKNGARLRKEEMQREIAACLVRGDQVYELFSVMVHSGSAMGGHYYAYIKCFEDERWYKFNDSSVTEVGEDEIKSAFGGNETKGWVKSSANAYLLAYRRVAEDNLVKVEDTIMPDYIREAVQRVSDPVGFQDVQKLESVIVIYEGQRRTFRTASSSKLAEFLASILKDLGMTQIPADQFRLRSFEPASGTFPEDYTGREESKLEELKIRNYKTLVLERKDESGEFLAYDQNNIYIKYVVWDDSLLASPLNLAGKVTAFARTLTINKLSRLQDFVDKLQKQTGIEASRIAIVRKGIGYGSAQADLVSTERNMKKTLFELRLGENAIVYVEELGDSGIHRKWQKEFEQDLYRISIKFNAPDDPPAVTSHDLTHKLTIDSRSDVRALKALISSDLNLPADFFIIRRGFSSMGLEIKDLEMKLAQLNLANGSGVFVEKGTPIKSDEIRLRATIMGEPSANADDGVCYSTYDLPSVIISASKSVQDAKVLIADKANEEYPSLNLRPSHFLLREQLQERVSRVIKESAGLRELQLFEGTRLCAQVFPSAVRELSPKEILIACKHWHPSTWELGAPVHLIVNRGETQVALAERLCALFSISQENLEVFKVVEQTLFVRSKLDKDMWQRLGSAKDRIESYPISLVADGQLLIVKDKLEPRRSPPVEEAKQAQHNGSKHAPSVITNAWKRKEKAIVIQVKGEKPDDTPS